MKRFITTTFIAAALLVTSCTKTAIPEGSNIYLCATLHNPELAKSPFEGSAPSSATPLNAIVLASTERYKYPNTGDDGTNANGDVAVHSTARFQSSTSQLLSGALYHPTIRPTVYFTSLHPQSGWDITSTSASFQFNGSQDVMFAPETTGSYESNPMPTLNYHHLLTYLKVKIGAESEDVSVAWGKIMGITIESKDEITVDLNKDYIYEDCVSLGATTTDMPFYKPGSDIRFPDAEGFDIPYPLTSAQYSCYTICAPVKAEKYDKVEFNLSGNIVRIPEYYITITSDNRSITVPVDLRVPNEDYYDGSTHGKLFTLNLSFLMGSNIAVSATVSDWETGGTGSGDINEDTPAPTTLNYSKK